MRRKVFLLHLVLLSFVSSAAYCADGRWSPPDLRATASQLPKLMKPLTLDGVLDEWAEAASVPVWSTSDVASLRKPHNWRGGSDAGMEVYCAWNSDGLCLAARVADDDVRGNPDETKLWEMDCLEFFIDGRPKEKLMKPPYSPGAYQLLVRPPETGRPAFVTTNPRDGAIAGLRVAGRRSDSGYSVELLVPWSAFPGFSAKPGSRLGLQFALDDYDSYDGKLVQPLTLSPGGVKDMWIHPELLVPWVLADSIEMGPDAALGPVVSISAPKMWAAAGAVPVSVTVGETLAPSVRSAQITVEGSDGKRVMDRTVRFSPEARPWERSARASFDWVPKVPSDGYYTIRVQLKDDSGRSVGLAVRPVLLLVNAQTNAITALRKADLPVMARTEPFRAAAYMGVAACVENLKRAVLLKDANRTISAVREIEARLDIVSRGKLSPDDEGLLRLLSLTADPEAQVVVQYPEGNLARVFFYCGSVPLVAAEVRQYGSPAAAKSSLRPTNSGESAHVEAACGNWAIRVTSPSEDAARLAVRLMSAGKPVKPEDVDLMRRRLVESLKSTNPPAAQAKGMHLYCGDLHAHTFYSDGLPSPAGLVFQAIHCFLDFAAITDHNTIDGAVACSRLLKDHRIRFPLICGEEITTEWSHFNAYPLREVISPEIPLSEMVKGAHSQGAAIQWNHPEAINSDWAKAHHGRAFWDTSLDAWEHVPSDYDAMKKEGILPPLTGTTDTHDGTFAYPERTLVLAASPDGNDVAEAVRAKRVAALSGHNARMLYGSDAMISRVIAALADGNALRQAKAEQIREILREADVVGVLSSGF